MNEFTELLDRVDASVFSGDALEYPKNRQELLWYCERWLRKLKELKDEHPTEA